MSEATDPQELQDKCDHDVCHCVPGTESAVVDGKLVYCSTGCQEGKGCDCAECGCASATD